MGWWWEGVDEVNRWGQVGIAREGWAWEIYEKNAQEHEQALLLSVLHCGK
jgi:hypothetical protein